MLGVNEVSRNASSAEIVGQVIDHPDWTTQEGVRGTRKWTHFLDELISGQVTVRPRIDGMDSDRWQPGTFELQLG